MTLPEFPSDPARYPEESQASTALVLGILSVVLLQPLGPFAWYMANQELAAISAGNRPPENRSTANAGRILGIIGTFLLTVGIVVIALLLAGAIAI